MMMLPKLSLIVYLYISVVLGLNIATNTIDRGAISLNVGDITINSGAYWSIINNAISAFVSNLEVAPEAGLYISSTSSLISLQVTLLGLLNSITNNGIISFNSLASLTSSNYNLIGWSFQNNGEMYLGASGIVASTMSITAASWKNTGLLVFYQNQRNEGIVNLGAPLGTINNNGQICFHNEVYHQTTSIAGTGCITADRDSSIYITNAALSVSTGQTFYLADGASSMIVQALSTPQTFNVRNFGQVNGIANKIGLSIPLFALIGSAWSYNSATGILTLRGAGLLLQYFNIGTGYDSSKFQVVTDSGAGLPSTLWGSIQYNGPVPNPGLPSQCRVCKSLPDIPGAQPTEYTTTITTTSNGNTLTETGIVDITTNTAGSWYTTTSIFTTGSTFRTEYTTSWTTTKPDGTIQTDSGIVSVSDTSLTTITTFPQPTQTEYTTTWTTTKDDGSVETDSGIVSQSGDSLTTITTFPQPTQTEYTTTWTTTKDDGSVETDSGIVSQSGDSLTTITTFPQPTQTEYTTTWTTTKDDGSVETDSGIVSQSGDSLTTITTFPQESVASPVTTEYTTTWTTTKDDGSVETDSGIVSQSGDSLTTITTFPQPTQTEYTTTWTTTKDDGSVETDSGIVSQSGDSLTTITTFPQESVASPVTTEYTTTWTTTKDDGSVETDSGIVSQSGDSLTTITTFPQESVASPVTTEYTTTWTTTKDDGSVETDWNVGSSPITTYVPTNTSSSISELIPGSSIVLEDSAGTISISEVDAPGQPDTGFAVGSSMVSYSTSLVAISDVARTSTLVLLEPLVSLGSPAVETTEVSNYSSETSESFSTRESAHTSNVSLSQAGSDEQYKSHTSRPSTLAEHTSGVQSTATIPAIYEGTGAITKYSTFVGVLASLIFVMV